MRIVVPVGAVSLPTSVVFGRPPWQTRSAPGPLPNLLAGVPTCLPRVARYLLTRLIDGRCFGHVNAALARWPAIEVLRHKPWPPGHFAGAGVALEWVT